MFHAALTLELQNLENMGTILVDDATATAFTGAPLHVQVEIPFTRSAID